MFTPAQKLILVKLAADTEFAVSRSSTGGMFLEAADTTIKVTETLVSVNGKTNEAKTGDILTISPSGVIVAHMSTISNKPSARKSSPDRANKSD